MKDSEIRGLILSKFYLRRKEGRIGVGGGIGNNPALDVSELDQADSLRVIGQLAEQGLLDWKPILDRIGEPRAGFGKITAFGVDIIEGERKPPIPIQIDQSRHEQHIHIEGQHGSVQVAGAGSNLAASVEQNAERIISAIDGANVSEAEKKEAKGMLAKFFQSAAARAAFGAAADALLKHCGH